MRARSNTGSRWLVSHERHSTVTNCLRREDLYLQPAVNIALTAANYFHIARFMTRNSVIHLSVQETL